VVSCAVVVAGFCWEITALRERGLREFFFVSLKGKFDFLENRF